MDEASLVETLYEARRTPAMLELPPGGFDFETALRLQLAVADRFAAAGEPVGGWKVGMTSGAARDMLGDGFRPHGYVLSSRIFASGDEIPLARFLNCGLEPEICLVLGSPLRGPATAEQARAAVRAVVPAFELNELRVAAGPDADHAALVADGVANWGIVLGPEAPLEALAGEVAATLFCDGEQVAQATTRTLPFDDPFLSLARLATSLAASGRVVEAGQPVLTGSFAFARVERPSLWRADFGPLGEVSVRFA